MFVNRRVIAGFPTLFTLLRFLSRTNSFMYLLETWTSAGFLISLTLAVFLSHVHEGNCISWSLSHTTYSRAVSFRCETFQSLEGLVITEAFPMFPRFTGLLSLSESCVHGEVLIGHSALNTSLSAHTGHKTRESGTQREALYTSGAHWQGK